MNAKETAMHKHCPATEYDPRFWRRMISAMAVSFCKYGPIARAYPHKVNAIGSLKQRLKLYEETGNADYLVDIASFAMIEFIHPAHEKAHDNPTDGGEGRKWHSGGPATERRNNGEAWLTQKKLQTRFARRSKLHGLHQYTKWQTSSSQSQSRLNRSSPSIALRNRATMGDGASSKSCLAMRR